MDFTWTPKTDGVDYVSADDVNALAEGILEVGGAVEAQAATLEAEFDAHVDASVIDHKKRLNYTGKACTGC